MSTVTITFDLDEPSDRRSYEVHKQVQGMLDVLQAITGRYAPGERMEGGGFKGLLKYDGVEAWITEAKKDYEETDFGFGGMSEVSFIARTILERFETAYYDLLDSAHVNLDIED